MASKQRTWLVAAVKLLIVGLLVWGVHRTLENAYDELRQHPLHPSAAWLAAAGGLYLLAMLPAALFWHRIMRVMGQQVGVFAAIRAYYTGHLGKYVPGKALVVVLRAGLVRAPGTSAAVAAVSVFVETLTMMASGSFLAAALTATLLWRHRLHWEHIAEIVHRMTGLAPDDNRQLYVAAGIAVAFVLVSGLPTLPPVFKRLIRMTRIGRADPEAAAQLQRIDYGTLLLGWLATGIGWFVMGLSLTAVLRGMGQSDNGFPMPGWIDGLPLTTMVVCVSVVVGFMSFVPGGLVVRDVVVAELIRPELGSEIAVVSAILLRLVWLAAELAAAALLYWAGAKPQAASLPNTGAPSNSPDP